MMGVPLQLKHISRTKLLSILNQQKIPATNILSPAISVISKLWMTMQQIGENGYRELITHDIAMARALQARGHDVTWISGANVAECAPITTDYVWQAREYGAKIIVVDPRITPIARTCDLYLPVKPGRDAAQQEFPVGRPRGLADNVAKTRLKIGQAMRGIADAVDGGDGAVLLAVVQVFAEKPRAFRGVGRGAGPVVGRSRRLRSRLCRNAAPMANTLR